MTSTRRVVTVGVDTHSDVHHAAVIDEIGRPLADAGFPTTPDGYRRLLAWAGEHGAIAAFGVEGTGAYGAGLARHLRAAGQAVIEVDRPDRKTRRQRGKSDPLDAYAAAAAVLSGAASGSPKTRDGRVEAIRTLRVARRSAIKGRTQAINQLKALVLTGPAELRQALAGQSTRQLLATCRRLRSTERLTEAADPITAAAKLTLRRLARRIAALTEEIDELDAELRPLVQATAPALMAVYGVGAEVAASCWSPPGITRNGCAPRPPSPSSAAPHPYRPAAAAPPATGSTAAATGTPTTPCTSSPSFGCRLTSRQRTTPLADEPKA
jgi:transposase